MEMIAIHSNRHRSNQCRQCAAFFSDYAQVQYLFAQVVERPTNERTNERTSLDRRGLQIAHHEQ